MEGLMDWILAPTILVGVLAVTLGIARLSLGREAGIQVAAQARADDGARAVPAPLLPPTPQREPEPVDTAVTDLMDRLVGLLRASVNDMTGDIALAQAASSGARVASADQSQTLRLLDANVRRMGALIDDAADLCALETGAMALASDRLDPGLLLSRACESQSPGAALHAVRLRAPALIPGLAVMADAPRLQQALDVILDHAIRITPRNGEVIVDMGHDDGVRISVRTPGVLGPTGAPLFAPPPVGSQAGFDLALARRLVEAMEGRLSFHAHPSGGAMILTLPLAA
jgi:signal transduction histidine kinase